MKAVKQIHKVYYSKRTVLFWYIVSCRPGESHSKSYLMRHIPTMIDCVCDHDELVLEKDPEN